MSAPLPSNEEQRLRVLHAYGILDTPAERLFDEIAELAALICGTPMSMISLVDSKRQWFKSRIGIAATETPREHAFCAHTILHPDHLFVVPDAKRDSRFDDNPLVWGDLSLQFYAGAPLVTTGGLVIGALCVADRKPRELPAAQQAGLQTLARQVVTQLELRRALDAQRKESEQARLMAQAVNACSDGIVVTDARLPDNPIILVNPAFERITGYSPAEVIGQNCRILQGTDRDQPGLTPLRSAIRQQRSCRVILRNYRKDGRPFWNELHISPVRNSAGELTHFIGVQSDVTARKEAEDALRQRETILDGVSAAAESLLNSSDYHSVLPSVLDQLGRSTNADSLILWQQEFQPSGQKRLRARDTWTSTHQPPIPDALRVVDWNETNGWPTAGQLRAGRAVQGSRDSCAPEERKLLEALNLSSFLCLPVLAGNGELWGILGIGCRREGVRWGFIEIEALRSATRMIGAVLHDRATGAALRASDERFRTVVNNLTEVVFQTDNAGRWTFLNPAWTQISGYTVDESLGTSFLEYIHPDDRDHNQQLFTPLIERKKTHCRHQARYLKKGGGFRWLEVYANLVLGPEDQILGTAGTLNDVTDHRIATETLEKQRAAIESAIDGVAILDDQGLFTHLNPTHVELFGFNAPEDLLGKSWRVLYSAAEIARFENEIIPHVRKHGRWRGSATGTRRDGQTFAEEISLTLVEGGGFVCVCRDITDRLSAEERIRSSLREKEVMLKEIHHRVKNNMQIVSSLLNLQLEHLRDEEARIQFMESQNRIASMALVHEKLYQSSDLARIDFTDYLRDLTDNLLGAFGADARNIVFELRSDDVHLTVDTAIPCGLIINELVSNAYKHAFPGGRSGRVTLIFEQLAEERLRIEVLDTGVGPPPELDLRQTHTLGMQLVNTLVHQLRGTLEFRRDGGTRFIALLHEATRRQQVRS